MTSVESLSGVAADVSRGFEGKFVEREMQLLSAILNGKALEHHLEPSYFKALQKAVLRDSSGGDNTDRESSDVSDRDGTSNKGGVGKSDKKG
jgi:hypothetical protein